MSAIGEIILALVKTLIFHVKAVAASIIGRILSAFGLTLVTFNGVLPTLKSFIMTYVQAVPPRALEIVSALGVDVAMTMILSALTVRLAWKVWIIPKSIADSMGAA
jgi:energy-converting hydrogenase Eha subunit G